MSLVEGTLLGTNLLIHTAIFLSAFYVALHNRTINQIIVTFLWYVGLSSFFLATSIVIQFILGDAFPLSYRQIGTIGETVFNSTVALTLGTVFALTVKADFAARKKRGKKTRKV